MWMMPLHLHVNQKSDYDDYDEKKHPSMIDNVILHFGLSALFSAIRNAGKFLYILKCSQSPPSIYQRKTFCFKNWQVHKGFNKADKSLL